MHQSALDIGTKFFETYWRPGFCTILDIGAADLNGSLRHVTPPGSDFMGIDLAAGPGVDLVLDDPYVYPFPDGHFDCVISTSCLEHDRMFWLTFLECSRVLSPRGVLYINAPSGGPYHGYPHDYWRLIQRVKIRSRNRTEASQVKIYRPCQCACVCHVHRMLRCAKIAPLQILEIQHTLAIE